MTPKQRRRRPTEPAVEVEHKEIALQHLGVSYHEYDENHMSVTGFGAEGTPREQRISPKEGAVLLLLIVWQKSGRNMGRVPIFEIVRVLYGDLPRKSQPKHPKQATMQVIWKLRKNIAGVHGGEDIILCDRLKRLYYLKPAQDCEVVRGRTPEPYQH